MFLKLRKEFNRLKKQEDRVTLGPLYLRGHVVYRGGDDSLGEWMKSEGATPEVADGFRDIATRAGNVLGCPLGSDPIDFWLHHLYHDLLRIEGHNCGRRAPGRADIRTELHGSSTEQSGLVLRLLESSAGYCKRLATEAPRRSLDGVGFAEPKKEETPSNSNLSQPAGAKKAQRPAWRAKNPKVQELKSQVRNLRDAHFSQLEICRRMDQSGASCPPGARWSNMRWVAAFTNKEHGSSVRKWISAA